METSTCRSRKRKQANPTKIPVKLAKTENCNRLLYNFFNVSCENLATKLLGKILVRQLSDGCILKGRIVETECYLGNSDKASHSYNGRRTERCEPMYMPAGTSYVYLTYGMHHCFNISSEEPGAAVLIRALEPLTALDKMKDLRFASISDCLDTAIPKSYKSLMLCNGPSNLCKSMGIVKEVCNKLNLADISNRTLWVEDDIEDNAQDFQIITTSRVGIESAGTEWAAMPLRYYIFGHTCVSKRDKRAENDFMSNLNHE